MKDRIRPWLPASRRLAIIEGSVLGVLCLFVLGRLLFTPSGVAEAEAPPPPPSAVVKMAQADRENLLAAFPPPQGTVRDRVSIMADLVGTLEKMELQLVSRKVESISRPGEFPSRQRVRLLVRGSSKAQALFLSDLVQGTLPITISAFHWSAGTGPEERGLNLVLDVLLVPAA